MSRWRAGAGCCLTIFAVAVLHAQGPISIRVVQGDNAINSIRMHRGHDPVVQVLGADGEPLAGVTVSFLLPQAGAGGTFGGSRLSATVQTDEHGMAEGRDLVPNRIEGQFRIRVTASWRGQTANANILQTNAEPEVKSSRSKWIIIAAIAGGAAAGGAALALHGGNSSQTPFGGTTGATPAGVTIVAGSPSLGPPH